MQRFSQLLVISLLLGGCAVQQTAPDGKPAHHTRSGFKNNYPHDNPSLTALLISQADFLIRDIKQIDFPIAANNPEWLRANRSQPTLTWIGHSTFLIQIGGINILTDPHFSERASPLGVTGPKRWAPPGLALQDLPDIDLIVVSHDHYDHLDLPSIKQLIARQPDRPPHLFVPLGLKNIVAGTGATAVTELDWWEEVAFNDLRLGPVPVQHHSGRTAGIHNNTLWAGWLIRVAGLKLFFAGDTGYSRDFQDLHARVGDIDFALLPIGSYSPRWYMKPWHVNPEEAVQVFQDINARYAVGMHWGTFNLLTDEDMDEPPKRFLAARDAALIEKDRVFVMQHGETKSLDMLFDSHREDIHAEAQRR